MAVQINWTGFATFSAPLTMLVYLPFLSTNQSSLMKNVTGGRCKCNCIGVVSGDISPDFYGFCSVLQLHYFILYSLLPNQC